MRTKIEIRNEASLCYIDIEGVIGASEEEQFSPSSQSIATYERLKEEITKVQALDVKEVVVNIRSTGGDVNDALLIYEALSSLDAKIITRCYGYTASAATIIAQAASEGCREVATSTLYLIHNSLCSTEGNAEELQAEVEMLKETDSRLAEIYASRSGRSVEEMATLMAENGGRGRWLSPSEALAEGLVDRVISHATEGASIIERSKQGVKALLKAIGIDADAERPSPEEDINYIPRERELSPLPKASSNRSLVALDEGQKSTKATRLKEVEDPSPMESPSHPRDNAYRRDVQALRSR